MISINDLLENIRILSNYILRQKNKKIKRNKTKRIFKNA